jgi:mRNA-degrading endonuclease YafQ of YafQ-DinJ toxin-antitoxin module
MKSNFRLTANFIKKARKLAQKNSKLEQDLAKQSKLFSQNPLHPSLKLHKLVGDRSEQYAIWIKGDLRALCIKHENIFLFFDLVTHDEY